MTVQCIECGNEFEAADSGPDRQFLCNHCLAEHRGPAAEQSASVHDQWVAPPTGGPTSGLSESDLFGSMIPSPEDAPPVAGHPDFDLVDERPEDQQSLLSGRVDIIPATSLDMSEVGPLDEPKGEPEPTVESAPAIPRRKTVESVEPALVKSVSTRPLRTVAVQLVLGGLLTMAIAAGATIYLNDGRLDASSWKTSKEVVTREVSSGFYSTRGGASVFYVRGMVENKGAKTGRVVVRAELIDGTQLLKSFEGLSGGTRNPEDLFRIESSDEMNAFNMNAFNTPGARPTGKLAPGQTAPFLLALFNPPPDLSGFRLRVTAALEEGGTSQP